MVRLRHFNLSLVCDGVAARNPSRHNALLSRSSKYTFSDLHPSQARGVFEERGGFDTYASSHMLVSIMLLVSLIFLLHRSPSWLTYTLVMPPSWVITWLKAQANAT